MCIIPSVREELDRKTVEAITQLTLSFDAGTMTQEAYYWSINAINLVTNGLIDEEVSLVLSDNLKENVPHFKERRIFKAYGSLVILIRELTEDYFVVFKIVSDGTKKTQKSYAEYDNPVKACSAAFELLAGQLIKKGFEEIES